MNYLITNDADGGTATLSTDSPMSSYGVPVLRISSADATGDFGPADAIRHRQPRVLAADIVAAWAHETDRTPDEIEAARLFLQQWPEGPQVE